MSRPKIYTEPRVATAVRLPSSLHGELQTAATERDVSVNYLVTRAVSAYLAQLPPAGANLPTEGEAAPS
jgi:predicted transcriptional regulator